MPLATASCQEMVEMGRQEEIPLAAIKCHKISEMRGGGMRGCRELPENARNRERDEVVASCPKVPEISIN